MSGDDLAGVIGGLMCLTLVGSSLLARRLPVGKTVRMAAAWIGIFGLAYVLFLFRGEVGAVWSRIASDFGYGAQAKGGALRIVKSDDGHFWARASVNGVSQRFLIDSGATVTVISADVAKAAGVHPLSGPAIPIETANGFISVQPARVQTLEVGPIVQPEARVVIGPPGNGTNVLGMTFLSSMKSWRAEGDTLILND